MLEDSRFLALLTYVHYGLQGGTLDLCLNDHFGKALCDRFGSPSKGGPKVLCLVGDKRFGWRHR